MGTPEGTHSRCVRAHVCTSLTWSLRSPPPTHAALAGARAPCGACSFCVSGRLWSVCPPGGGWRLAPAVRGTGCRLLGLGARLRSPRFLGSSAECPSLSQFLCSPVQTCLRGAVGQEGRPRTAEVPVTGKGTCPSRRPVLAPLPVVLVGVLPRNRAKRMRTSLQKETYYTASAHVTTELWTHPPRPSQRSRLSSDVGVPWPSQPDTYNELSQP